MVSLRVVYLFLSLLLYLTHSRAGEATPTNSQAQLLPSLLIQCKEDVALYCPGNITFSYIAISVCLQNFDQVVSTQCADFRRGIAVGACNDDAARLCSNAYTVHELEECIAEHEAQLNQQCKLNLNMRFNYNNRHEDAEQKSERFTKAITGLCFVYLLIALIATGWAIHQSYTLRTDQKSIVLDNIGTVSELSTKLPVELAEWCVEFHQLTYRRPNTTNILWPGYNANERARVFHKVSGVFKSGQVSAIVGSRSSGTSSLLSLLAGRTLHGELTGIRAVGGMLLSPKEYDKVVRQQGYVSASHLHVQHQHSNSVISRDQMLVEGAMSVWQALLHAALLRLPESFGRQKILMRAWEVLHLVGLQSVRDVLIDQPGGRFAMCGKPEGHSTLSRYQRQCLHLATQLLNLSQAIFIEEPTSQLSSVEAAVFMKLLQKFSKVTGAAVVITAEQPSAEEYRLLDTILVLSPAGDMLYSGPASTSATSFFTSLQCAPQLRALRRTQQSERLYATPVDFLFDAVSVRQKRLVPQHETGIAVEENEDAELEGLLSGSGTHDHGDVEMMEVMDTSNGSDAESSTRRAISSATIDEVNGPSIPLSRDAAVEIIHDKFIDSSEYMQLHERREMLLRRHHSIDDKQKYTNSHRVEEADSLREMEAEEVNQIGPEWNRLPVVQLQYMKKGSGVPPLTQVWVLFSQRVQTEINHIRWNVLLIALSLLVISLFCVLISRPVHSVLEKPQQAAMLLSLVSLFVVTLQSVLILSQNPFAGLSLHTNEWAHQLSALLSDVPSAVAMCVPALWFVYWWHPLNPALAHVAFAFVCFVTGVCAWQSFVRLSAVLFLRPHPLVCWAVVALVLAVGTLLGSGLVVSLQDLPNVLHFVPYVSISAILQRALVENDLHCCYLSTTCASLDSESSEPASFVCPKSLHFTGDGTDEGNLGRYYLQTAGMAEERPHLLLFVLFWTNAILRVVTALILQRRNRSNLKVKFL